MVAKLRQDTAGGWACVRLGGRAGQPAQPAMQPAAVAISYRPKPLPLDGEGFVQPFGIDDLAGAREFFDEFGFVVVDGVLSEAERTETINDIWGVIEGYCGGRLGIQRDHPGSWRQHWPGGGPGLLGQALSPAAWHTRLGARGRAPAAADRLALRPAPQPQPRPLVQARVLA